MPRVLFPLPELDFDPTEVAVPWRLLVDAGCQVVFATPSGRAVPRCDERTLVKHGLGLLGARAADVALYEELEAEPDFREPAAYDDIDPASFDAVSLTGGHAPGMWPYLESAALRETVRALFDAGKPVGAICHGTVVLARARDAAGRPLLSGRTATCLPAWMEWAGYLLTFWTMGRHYRTYDATAQEEVEAALGPSGRFLRGPLSSNYAKPFVVEDGNLVTARWPGDARAYGEALVDRLRVG